MPEALNLLLLGQIVGIRPWERSRKTVYHQQFVTGQFAFFYASTTAGAAPTTVAIATTTT